MGRKRIQFSSTLKAELMDDLRNLSDNSGIPISKLLDQSIGLLLEHYNSNYYRNSIGKRTNSNKDEFDEISNTLIEEDETEYNTNQESKFGEYTISMDKIKEIQKALDIIVENQNFILNTADEMQNKKS